MNCPNCGHNNRPNAKFCAQCRAALRPVVNRNMRACPQCSKQNRQDAKFCGGCGYTFTKPTHASVATQTQTPSRSSLYLGFAAIILAVVCLGIFVAIRQQNGSSSASTDLTATPTVEQVVGTQVVPAQIVTETPLPPEKPIDEVAPILGETTPVPKSPTPIPTIVSIPPTSEPTESDD